MAVDDSDEEYSSVERAAHKVDVWARVVVEEGLMVVDPISNRITVELDLSPSAEGNRGR